MLFQSTRTTWMSLNQVLSLSIPKAKPISDRRGPGDHSYTLSETLEELHLHGYHWASGSANENGKKGELLSFTAGLADGLYRRNSSRCRETIRSFDCSQLPATVHYVTDSSFSRVVSGSC